MGCPHLPYRAAAAGCPLPLWGARRYCAVPAVVVGSQPLLLGDRRCLGVPAAAVGYPPMLWRARYTRGLPAVEVDFLSLPFGAAAVCCVLSSWGAYRCCGVPAFALRFLPPRGDYRRFMRSWCGAPA